MMALAFPCDLYAPTSIPCPSPSFADFHFSFSFFGAMIGKARMSWARATIFRFN